MTTPLDCASFTSDDHWDRSLTKRSKVRCLDAAILRNQVGKFTSFHRLVQSLHRSFAELLGVQKTLFCGRICACCRFKNLQPYACQQPVGAPSTPPTSLPASGSVGVLPKLNMGAGALIKRTSTNL